jgi:hypothetical protein
MEYRYLLLDATAASSTSFILLVNKKRDFYTRLYRKPPSKSIWSEAPPQTKPRDLQIPAWKHTYNVKWLTEEEAFVILL